MKQPTLAKQIQNGLHNIKGITTNWDNDKLMIDVDTNSYMCLEFNDNHNFSINFSNGLTGNNIDPLYISPDSITKLQTVLSTINLVNVKN